MLHKRSGPELARAFTLLSLLLKHGVTLVEALDALSTDAQDQRLGEALRIVRLEIMNGSPPSLALEHFPEVFPSTVVEIVRTGEGRAHLDDVASAVAETLGPVAPYWPPPEDQEELGRLLNRLSLLVSAGSASAGAAQLAAEPRLKTLHDRFEKIARRLEERRKLSPVLAENPDLFPEPLPDLVKAAEKNDRVVQVLRELAGGLRSGSFSLASPTVPSLVVELKRLFFLLSVYLQAGVPLKGSLHAVGATLGREDLRAQVKEMTQSEGLIANVMHNHPDVYPHSLCLLVEKAEQGWDAAATFKTIADGLERGRFLPKEYH